MSDELVLPDDLIQIQRDLDAARAAADDYVAEVEAQLFAQLAEAEGGDEGPAGLRWSEEQNAELNRLRANYLAVAKTKWAHPALQRGTAFEDALRAAARQPEPANA